MSMDIPRQSFESSAKKPEGVDAGLLAPANPEASNRILEYTLNQIGALSAKYGVNIRFQSPLAAKTKDPQFGEKLIDEEFRAMKAVKSDLELIKVEDFKKLGISNILINILQNGHKVDAKQDKTQLFLDFRSTAKFNLFREIYEQFYIEKIAPLFRGFEYSDLMNDERYENEPAAYFEALFRTPASSKPLNPDKLEEVRAIVGI